MKKLTHYSLLAVVSAAFFLISPTASAQDETSDADWVLATLTETASDWRKLDFVEKVASALRTDMADLGGGWYWSITGYYFYFQEPYIYNQIDEVWLYATTDDSGVYFYNFAGKQWDWWDRNGGAQISLSDPVE